MSVAAASLACLLPQAVFADGSETLAPPSIPIASGTEIIAAGTGMVNQPGTIDLSVPGGATVNQVLLYWQGFGTAGQNDDTVTVNGQTVVGTLIGGPDFFFDSSDNPNSPSAWYSSTFRADITALGLVGPGANSLTISDMDFTIVNNGAGVMAIIDDGSTASAIEIRDGDDIAWIGWNEPRRSTVPQTFNFDASASDRTATVSMLFGAVAGSVSGGGFRPSVIEVTVGGVVTEIIDALDSVDGEEWDTLIVDINIPAGATSLTIQAISDDRNDNGQNENPASFVWIGAGLKIPGIPQNPDIDLLKEVSVDGGITYFDANDAGSAPTDLGGGAIYRLIVSNTGDVDLTNVVINDPTLGITDVLIADLPVGDSRTLDSGDIPALEAPDVCDAPGTVTNVASVSADPVGGGDAVSDSDPANVICPEERVGCWFTGGQNIQVNRVKGQPEHSGGGNIYPSCSASPGDGGQWTHTDHVKGLHFQARSLTVVECGNVTEIPPGAPSPAVTVNYIRATATGIIKGIGDNTAPERPAVAIVLMEDWGEPGRNDKYTILATGGADFISLNRAPLENGGNFQIHQTSCDN